VPEKDTIYKMPFTVKGSTIDEIPLVTVKGSSDGTARINKDFVLYDADSLKRDSLEIRAKNYDGSFLLKVTGGLSESKTIALKIKINDQGTITEISKNILLKPFVKAVPVKAPEKQDSLIINLYNEVDIPVQDTMCYSPRRFLKKKKEKACTININDITVQKNKNGTYTFIVRTTEGERYSNSEGITIKEKWDAGVKVHLNGDTSKPSLLLKDFLEILPDSQATPTRTLTPQNRTFKIEASKN
jgi:hypothetical protein